MTKAQLVRIEKREDHARQRIEDAVGAAESLLEVCRGGAENAQENPVWSDGSLGKLNVARMEADVVVSAVEHAIALLDAARFILADVPGAARKVVARYP